jgi:hypothetical protein
MGWIVDGAYDHEGYVANVLADGRVSGGSTGGGVIVHELTLADEAAGYEVRRFPRSDNVDVIVPWDQVATWRVTCACGWTGPELPAVANPKHGDRYCPEDVEDREFLPHWQAHVAPYTALTELGEMADRLRALERELADKVTLARTAGASWTQIGREAGLTRQGAQQRWGSQTENGKQRVSSPEVADLAARPLTEHVADELRDAAKRALAGE